MKKVLNIAPYFSKKYLVAQKIVWKCAIWIILLLASLLKLWLVAGQHLDIISVPLSPYDQGLFYTLAENIKQGYWLGPYNDLTLAKGPFYPIYLALTSMLHIPLLRSEQVLYIFACFIFLVSIQPLLKLQTIKKVRTLQSDYTSGFITLVLGIFLIFEPMTSDFSSGFQVIREGIYPALTLLTFSLFITLLTHYRSRLWKYILIAIATGISLSAFWLTREEGSWIDPYMIILSVYIFILIYRRRARLPHFKWKLIVLLLPFLMLQGSIFTVSVINNRKYGVDSTVEFKTPQFLAAYSSLTRVKNNKWLPLIPVSIYQRQLIYQVSPAFDQLKPYLDGGLGQSWVEASNMGPPYQGQLNGGTFMWVFRRSVQDMGYYKNGETAMNYYATLAKQVNGACADKKLICNKSTDSMSPPLDKRYIKPFDTTFLNAWPFFVGFQQYNPVPINDTGDITSIDQIGAFTHQSTTNLYGHKRVELLADIGGIYQSIFPAISIMAIIAYLTVGIIKRPYKDPLFVITSLIGLSIVFRIILLTLITVTSFEGINTLYLSCMYPLLIIFDGLSFVLAYRWYYSGQLKLS